MELVGVVNVLFVFLLLMLFLISHNFTTCGTSDIADGVTLFVRHSL